MSGGEIASGIGAPFESLKVRVSVPNSLPVTGRFERSREGFTFGQEPTEISAGDLGETPDEISARLIRFAEDPYLKVVVVQEGQPDFEVNAATFRATLQEYRASLNLCPHCGKSID